MADPTSAWISDNLCAWCEEAIPRVEDASLNIPTGRVVHTRTCEDDLQERQHAFFSVLFRGADFTLEK